MHLNVTVNRCCCRGTGLHLLESESYETTGDQELCATAAGISNSGEAHIMMGAAVVDSKFLHCLMLTYHTDVGMIINVLMLKSAVFSWSTKCFLSYISCVKTPFWLKWHTMVCRRVRKASFVADPIQQGPGIKKPCIRATPKASRMGAMTSTWGRSHLHWCDIDWSRQSWLTKGIWSALHALILGSWAHTMHLHSDISLLSLWSVCMFMLESFSSNQLNWRYTYTSFMDVVVGRAHEVFNLLKPTTWDILTAGQSDFLFVGDIDASVQWSHIKDVTMQAVSNTAFLQDQWPGFIYKHQQHTSMSWQVVILCTTFIHILGGRFHEHRHATVWAGFTLFLQWRLGTLCLVLPYCTSVL